MEIYLYMGKNFPSEPIIFDAVTKMKKNSEI